VVWGRRNSKEDRISKGRKKRNSRAASAQQLLKRGEQTGKEVQEEQGVRGGTQKSAGGSKRKTERRNVGHAWRKGEEGLEPQKVPSTHLATQKKFGQKQNEALTEKILLTKKKNGGTRLPVKGGGIQKKRRVLESYFL